MPAGSDYQQTQSAFDPDIMDPKRLKRQDIFWRGRGVAARCGIPNLLANDAASPHTRGSRQLPGGVHSLPGQLRNLLIDTALIPGRVPGKFARKTSLRQGGSSAGSRQEHAHG